MHCNEIPFMNFFFGICAASVPTHIHVCERFINSQDQSTYFPAAEEADRSWEYINLSQIDECRNWEREHYNFVFKITVSFLRINKWEQETHTGFSPALHLQCGIYFGADKNFKKIYFASLSIKTV
jgi:hypothetical protein